MDVTVTTSSHPPEYASTISVVRDLCTRIVVRHEHEPATNIQEGAMSSGLHPSFVHPSSSGFQPKEQSLRPSLTFSFIIGIPVFLIPASHTIRLLFQSQRWPVSREHCFRGGFNHSSGICHQIYDLVVSRPAHHLTLSLSIFPLRTRYHYGASGVSLLGRYYICCHILSPRSQYQSAAPAGSQGNTNWIFIRSNCRTFQTPL